MRKEYLKPFIEEIEAECIQHIAGSNTNNYADGKENNPNDDDNEGDIWNPKYNIWD